jgi:hypothetical protein
MKAVSREALIEALNYDPQTGFFTWKNEHRSHKAGDRADKSADKDRYRCVNFNGGSYPAHHLAWFYVYGVWPRQLDHKDRNGCNNAISNLREASYSQNQGNTRARRNNKLGVKGICRTGNRYRSMISPGGKTQHLGSFKTKEEAAKAYLIAAQAYYGEFAFHLDEQRLSQVVVCSQTKRVPVNKPTTDKQIKAKPWRRQRRPKQYPIMEAW